MVANSGLMVTLRVLDRLLDGPRVPDTLAFHDALLEATGRLSVRIARQWQLPPTVIAALGARLRPAPAAPDAPDAPDAGHGALSEALRTTDRVSKRLVIGESGVAAGEEEAACQRQLQRVFGA